MTDPRREEIAQNLNDHLVHLAIMQNQLAKSMAEMSYLMSQKFQEMQEQIDDITHPPKPAEACIYQDPTVEWKPGDPLP